jgi:hypothetical protein
VASLHEREFKLIGRSFGISEQSAKRLLANTSVSVEQSDSVQREADALDDLVEEQKEINRPSSPLRLRIGLYLQSGEGLERVDSARLISLAEDAIRQYRRACPEVTNWLIKGDFNPSMIPLELPKAKLVHACRTAGRIRAWVFQQLQKSRY